MNWTKYTMFAGSLIASVVGGLGIAGGVEGASSKPVYLEENLKDHPGANPMRDWRGHSRWLPHQGKQEIARRLRQGERVEINKRQKLRPYQRDLIDKISDPTIKIEAKVAKVPEKTVTWTSSNVEKTGVITHLVPAGQIPADVGAKVKDAKIPRDHDSYVVLADGKTYWPRVSLLNFA